MPCPAHLNAADGEKFCCCIRCVEDRFCTFLWWWCYFLVSLSIYWLLPGLRWRHCAFAEFVAFLWEILFVESSGRGCCNANALKHINSTPTRTLTCPSLPASTLLIEKIVRLLVPPSTRHDLGGAGRAWDYFTVKQAWDVLVWAAENLAPDGT